MEKMATRNAYGKALKNVGSRPDIVALDADVSTCTMSCEFGQSFPDRFFNMGIAEANMIGTAAGMAAAGLTPFVHSFAMFIAGRGYEQVRNSVAYPNLNVKLVGSHAGLTVGEDGATHQCIEDISIMRTIPNMTVICPADACETEQAVKAIADYKGPVYLRLGRLPVETVTQEQEQPFSIGKGRIFRERGDIAVFTTGLTLQMALAAQEDLEQDNIHIRVIHMPTIKPIDRELIIRAAKETQGLLTVEEHSIIGGLGSAVAEVVTQEYPVRVEKIGVQDTFGESGNALEVLKKYGITKEAILQKVYQMMEKTE